MSSRSRRPTYSKTQVPYLCGDGPITTTYSRTVCATGPSFVSSLSVSIAAGRPKSAIGIIACTMVMMTNATGCPRCTHVQAFENRRQYLDGLSSGRVHDGVPSEIAEVALGVERHLLHEKLLLKLFARG